MRPSRDRSIVADAQNAVSNAQLEAEFRKLAGQWRRDTEYLSSVAQMANHPAYQRIIEMGRPAVPLILRELQRKPDHWFWALNAITGEDPVQTGAAFDDAVQAWLRWGRAQGYLD
jgi:hypothetical protein